jgi:HD superfamily phosphohydrolase
LRALKSDRQQRALLTSNYLDTGISVETLLMIGILVHDLGHPPLSHTLEDTLALTSQGLNHDHYWLPRLLQEDEELQTIFTEFGVAGLPYALLAFMGYADQPKHFLASLVAGQLDMDRLDYLLRDSHFMGTQYGNIELDRLISSMLIDERPNGQPAVSVTADAMPALEHYLFGRHQAYKMALHPLDKASEALLKMVLTRFAWCVQHGVDTGHPAKHLYQLMINGQALSVEGYLRMDDYYLWNAIHAWSLEADDPLLRHLADRMMRHDLPKFVDLTEWPVALLPDTLAEAKVMLQAHYASRDLDFDFGFVETLVAPKPLYRRDKEPIWVTTPESGVVDMAEVSTLLAMLRHGEGPTTGQQHLWLVWDREAQRLLKTWLATLSGHKAMG